MNGAFFDRMSLTNAHLWKIEHESNTKIYHTDWSVLLLLREITLGKLG